LSAAGKGRAPVGGEQEMVETASAPLAAAEHSGQSPARGLWYDAWRRLRRNRLAVAGGVAALLLALLALFAPLVAPYNPIDQDYNSLLQGPSLAHPFGTDNFGRDIFSRIIWGGRISLTVGFLGTLFGMMLGIGIGLFAGFYGGWFDGLSMRLLDIQLAFPGLLLSITIIAILGVGAQNVVIAVAIFSVPAFARVLRGSILALKRQEFITAARAIGVSNQRLMFLHLLPNAVAPVLVIATLRLGTAILTASSLSFLGLGIRPPSPEWGAMLSDGRQYLQLAPHVAIFPGLAILVIMLALNLLGDGLRDALDPKIRKAR
jgi:glutathione transport system permease protein